MNYLLTLLGLLLYVAMALAKTKRTHKKDFKIRIWFEDNYLSIFIALISAFALDFMIYDVIALLHLPNYILVIYFANGYLNVSLIKKLFDIITPKKLRK